MASRRCASTRPTSGNSISMSVNFPAGCAIGSRDRIRPYRVGIHCRRPSRTVTTAKSLTQAGYKRLLRDVSKLLTDARERAERATLPILLEAYWHVGKRITHERLTDRAGYARSILAELAADLGLNERVLQHAVQLHLTYPKPPTDTGLGWAHYRELTRIKDPDERAFYERLAVDGGLSRNALVRAIRDDTYVEEPAPTSTGRRASRLTRPGKPTYIYRATVTRVIDGDTLLLDIDLGFDIVTRQRVRLASVDAAPAKTKEGRRAHTYVRDELARAAVVVVKTYKSDAYGRYVADVFYSTRKRPPEEVFARGRFLNQRLLDEGLATKA